VYGPSACDGPILGNITVLEGTKSGSVHVNAAKKESLNSVSCGYESCGHGVAQAKLASVGGPSCNGPVGNITVLEVSKCGSGVHVDAVKKESLDPVSCGYKSCSCSVAQVKVASMGGPSCNGPVGNINVSEVSKCGSGVHVDAVKKESLDPVSCGYESCGRSVAQVKVVSMGGPSCDGPVGNITVSECLKSGSGVHVDAVKKESLNPVSCGYKSCGRSFGQAKLASVGGPSCNGPVLGNITVSEGSKSGSVHVDAVKKESLNPVSCGYKSCGCSVTQAKLASVGGPSCDGPVLGNITLS
jgi:hypothetical protein